MSVEDNYLFQGLINHLPEPRIVVKPDAPNYTIVACNKPYQQALQMHEADIIGKGVNHPGSLNIFKVKNASSVVKYIEEVMSNRQPVMLNINYIKNNVVRSRPWQLEFITIPNNKGEVDYLIGCYYAPTELDSTIYSLQQPIEVTEALEREQVVNEELTALNEELNTVNLELSQTQQQLIELNQSLEKKIALRTQELSESEARFRVMAEGTDVLIAVSDTTKNTVYCNQAWTQLTGKSEKELLGFGWLDAIHPDDLKRHLDVFLTAFKNRAPFSDEVRMLSKHQRYCWLLVKGTPRFYIDGEFVGFVNSAVDITEQKRDEQRKNDFIGIVSHELKTPLTSINGYVQILQLKARKNKDDSVLGTLDRATHQIKKMTAMINGFLNVSRLESGKILIEKTTFLMNDLINEVIAESSFMQTTHHFTYSFEETILIKADRDKIGNVLTNLLSNAVKYSPQGKLVEIACKTEGNSLVVSVRDEGIGVSTSDKTRLFERFYRSESMQTQTISGFGIGLYVCAEIIQRHNGKIGVESEPGKGSTFWFSLPLN